LSASESVHRIYALASHSLPVIRCSSDSDGAEIKLHQSDTKLRALKRLSPLFSRLCNDGSSIFIKDQGLEGALGSLKRRKSSFQIVRNRLKITERMLTILQLFSTGAGPQKLFVCPMTSPPEWNEMLSRLSSLESKQAKPKIAMICGPKSSGKSTFTRLLTNYFLTKQISRSQKRQAGVAILDLDPGQPEFSPPGQLTLVHLLKPNFGPPYSHTVALKGARRIIRAHSIGSVSPAADPVLYSSCLRDLLRHYHELLRSIPECPLIINTPGWVLGTGLELLVDIIKLARPTDVIYMSQEGPLDVVTTLESAIKPRPFYALPSQLSEYTTRSAANLRTMQMMSYFHTEEDKNGLKWNATPLTSVAPLEVQYNGQAAGILGIMCIGEQPPPEMLISTINGNILAVVVIDDTAAIPGWPGDGHDHSMDNSGTREERHALAAASTRTLQRPLIIKTREGLPYFNPANAIVLDPRFSHSVGLALVRGIDTNRHKLQLITPISPEIINDIRNSEKYIVLVSGKLDTPGWAYTEELNRRTALAKSRRKLAAVSSEDENSGESGSVNDDDDNETSGSTSGDEAADDGEGGKEGDEFENIPWIEKIHGHEGRGPGARVWRVRRDLGRNGNGD
jgi:polynucleotide 5'-hydroxyl-kinase GRC3/NOL9